jgi:hypothetical protein
VQGEDLFLIAKPGVSSNSIAGVVVLTSDREDGLLFAGELTLTQGDTVLQTTRANDGVFVFEEVQATGDLRVVVTELPAGYEQEESDGFFYNYDGAAVDDLTIRLTPTDEPTPAEPGVNWLVILLVSLGIAAAVVIITLVVRRQRKGGAANDSVPGT